jgi:anti-anti-sigma factor
MSEADRRPSADDNGEAAQTPQVITHPRSGLSMRLHHTGSHTDATVSGEIDHTSADLFERALVDHLLRGSDSLDLGLGRVAFFDCAGLNALLRARSIAEHTGATLTLTALSPAVRRVLDLTGSHGLFTCATDDGAVLSRSDRPPQPAHPVRRRKLQLHAG